MSQAKDTFFELLQPKIEAHGFVLKKSKGKFEKIENGLLYTINFSWDGRGGITYLNSCNGLVDSIAISKAVKKLTGNVGLNHCPETIENCRSNLIRQMYSPSLIELANKMAFKKMAEMTFEEKYPMQNIIKTVENVEAIILNRILPFFRTIQSELDIYNNLVKKLNKNEGPRFHFNCNVMILYKLFALKTNQELPLLPMTQADYIKQFHSFYSYMNKVDFNTLEERMHQYKF